MVLCLKFYRVLSISPVLAPDPTDRGLDSGSDQDSFVSIKVYHVLPSVFNGSKLEGFSLLTTVELQWLEHLWDHENMFETRVVRASEC